MVRRGILKTLVFGLIGGLVLDSGSAPFTRLFSVWKKRDLKFCGNTKFSLIDFVCVCRFKEAGRDKSRVFSDLNLRRPDFIFLKNTQRKMREQSPRLWHPLFSFISCCNLFSGRHFSPRFCSRDLSSVCLCVCAHPNKCVGDHWMCVFHLVAVISVFFCWKIFFDTRRR